ncbi:hypothetical protein CSV71_12910 [Sporosarcina sp. P21c]|uniref:hypothetical protein n=1 Tax=unclassified Sporosarcina TaxID=2647733 RepID=UPI000C16DB1A|nr:MULTISPECIES: hypothetical protein [unclassified Sporosarcina]PIC66166.1 hypothetical protein CSV78_13970 [Sporosarcina sp. P16a]PIC88807.1 hypothetical protein CSV71_12910 [Sporosarcina sp. P21c]PIC91830.1 hypothetical protein CSV70_13640 [Sporosarcina sp. P25]
MRNKMVFSLCLTVVTSLLFACGSENLEKDVKATFVGTIEEIHSSGTAYVSEIEANDNKLSGTVEIDLPENVEETIHVGDKVIVGYDGTTMEVAPVGISTITIEKVK